MSENKIEFEKNLVRDYEVGDWPIWLDVICKAREVEQGDVLSKDEFSALAYASGITVQMAHFDWEEYTRYVHNVRDFFNYAGCTLKKMEPFMCFSRFDMEALKSLYFNLKVLIQCLERPVNFATDELRKEMISFVVRLAQKGYVFAT